MTADGVLVVGSLTVDLTAISTELPLPGETIIGSGFELVAGGKGGNQALAAARMGAPTWMAGRVGDDSFAQIVRDAMTGSGVHVDHLLPTTNTRTGIAHIRVDAHGENDIVMVPLANADLSPADVDAAVDSLGDRIRVLLTQLEIPAATAVHALARGRDSGLFTVLDPAPATVLPDSAWPLVDVITPNETEAKRLTGIDVVDLDSAERAARQLLGRGCRAALITLGEAGSLLVTGAGAPAHLPATAVAAIDTTAAGDAFAGALGARIAAGDTLADAVTWAGAAGALATTVLGASPSIPSLDQVRALLDAAGRKEA